MGEVVNLLQCVSCSGIWPEKHANCPACGGEVKPLKDGKVQAKTDPTPDPSPLAERGEQQSLPAVVGVPAKALGPQEWAEWLAAYESKPMLDLEDLDSIPRLVATVKALGAALQKSKQDAKIKATIATVMLMRAGGSVVIQGAEVDLLPKGHKLAVQPQGPNGENFAAGVVVPNDTIIIAKG